MQDTTTSYISYDLGMEVKPTRPRRMDIHKGSARIVRSKKATVESGDDGQGE